MREHRTTRFFKETQKPLNTTMAKTKNQKELLASVAQSTLAWNYDLTRVDAREYAAPLQVLFNSQIWKDIFIRRNKLFGAAMHGDPQAFKQIDQLDKKVAMLILQAMFHFCQERQKQIDGQKVTLNEYFTDFVRTPEQHELYNQFSNEVDSAMLLADVLENVLKGAQETLTKLDPALILSEFDSIKAATKALGDFSHIHHRDEHEELASIFCDCAEEVEEYLRMKTSLFIAKYRDLRESLINNGKMTQKVVKKHTDREYTSDLLANYFHNTAQTETEKATARSRANEAIKQFSDEELQEAMPIIIDLYRQAEAIHMAKEHINGTIKTLPETEATKKIVDHIL